MKEYVDITNKQKDVLVYIDYFISECGYPPSRAEIADAFECYPNAAQCHVEALERRGAIEFTPGVARSIRITRFGKRQLRTY